MIFVNTSKGDIKVGDKFVIEIGEIIPDKNGKLLYKIKGFNALVFDDVGIDKLERSSYTNADLFLKAWENGYDAARDASVNAVEDALKSIKR